MKYIYNFILLICLLPMVTYATIGNNSSLEDINVYLFTNECEECLEAEKWLTSIYNKYSRLNNRIVNVKEDNKYLEIFDKLGISNKYPVLIIGTNYYIGFNDKIKTEVETLIQEYSKASDYCDIMNTELSVKECQKINNNIYNDHNYLVYLIIPLVVIVIGGTIVIVLKRKKNSK